ncbi:MAG: hypothetical protein AAFX99_11535 [Myxococcota bacterium]
MNTFELDEIEEEPNNIPQQQSAGESFDTSKFDERRNRLAERKPMKKRKKGYYSSLDVQAKLQQIDPNAVVQTGPGLPNWSWQSWRLSWTGPVSQGHTIQLWMLSPTWNRALTFLRIALLIAMAVLLIARRDMTWTRPKEEEDGFDKGDDDGLSPNGTVDGGSAGAATAVVAGLIAVVTLATPTPTLAQGTPSETMLKELEARLLEQSMCQGPCVVIGRAEIEVTDRTWTMRAEAHVQKDSSWALPGPADPLRLDTVKVDGQPTLQLRRDPGGLTSVRIPAGRHTLEVVGQLVNRNVVTVQFDEATRPRTVTFRSEMWAVDGINDRGVPDSSLQLTRRQPADTTGSKPESTAVQELPPWYQVTRDLALGMPWQLRTKVVRNDPSRPQLVKLPLVPGEKIISEGFRVENGQVLVDFPRGVSQVSYVGELPITPDITLTAATEQPWSETWNVECSRMWRCAFSELPPVRTIDGDRTYLPTWQPWPGEQLVITINRPKGIEGQASTVDQVHYKVTPGKRLLQANLEMTVRASQGGWQKVTLPEGAELQSVQINGASRNIRPRDQVVTLPLQPGQQTFLLTWQQPWERSIVEQMPTVKIGQAAVNARLAIHRGDARWLLWANGPAWGPAIVFWGHLIIILVLAVILGQFRTLHLKTWEWLLLALGFSQLPVPALIPVVAWFGLLHWRQRQPQSVWWRFDLLQLTLAGLTLICVVVLSAAIRTNLLIDVDMQVRGAQSTNHVLRWYIDQIGPDGALPAASIISLPILVWRLIMLAWALWLVSRLLVWVPWGWQAFSHNGLWRGPNRTPSIWPFDHKASDDNDQSTPPESDSPADTAAADDTDEESDHVSAHDTHEDADMADTAQDNAAKTDEAGEDDAPSSSTDDDNTEAQDTTDDVEAQDDTEADGGEPTSEPT